MEGAGGHAVNTAIHINNYSQVNRQNISICNVKRIKRMFKVSHNVNTINLQTKQVNKMVNRHTTYYIRWYTASPVAVKIF